MAEIMVTTVDNPFNYFTQFNEWHAYDVTHHHHTLPFLARVAKVSHEMSEADQAAATERAVKEIVKYNVSGLYRIVEAPAA